MTAAHRIPFDLEDVTFFPSGNQQVRLEPTAKRVRAYFGDVAIVDSTRVQMMFETGRLPVYYFPVEYVRTDLLVPAPRTATSPIKGRATYLSLKVRDRVALDACWRYQDSPAGSPDLSGLIAFHWRQLDAWFEEDEEVIAHARDPYHRIDVLRSSRRVQVSAGGVPLADTRDSRMLFETHLPTRFYIPVEDVNMERLSRSGTVTSCAYKGTTTGYWDLKEGPRDIAWMYEQPRPEVGAIAGLVCFFNERAEISVDGTPQAQPPSPWS